jgi:hypothetical protein
LILVLEGSFRSTAVKSTGPWPLTWVVSQHGR